MLWFRGIRFVKDFMVQYLNHIFLAGAKGSLLFTDGTNKIVFSDRTQDTPRDSILHSVPKVIKIDSWDVRSVPCVLIGNVTGGFQYKSINKDLINTPEITETQVRAVGGDMLYNMDLKVMATTTEERDNIADIVCIYLSHPDAKNYWLKQNIVLPEAPRVGGEAKISQPPTDYPIYARDLSIPLLCSWRDTSEEDERLEDIIADVTVVIDL